MDKERAQERTQELIFTVQYDVHTLEDFVGKIANIPIGSSFMCNLQEHLPNYIGGETLHNGKIRMSVGTRAILGDYKPKTFWEIIQGKPCAKWHVDRINRIMRNK